MRLLSRQKELRKRVGRGALLAWDVTGAGRGLDKVRVASPHGQKLGLYRHPSFEMLSTGRRLIPWTLPSPNLDFTGTTRSYPRDSAVTH